MRKVSKNRTDDDVVSSTNGSASLANEEQQDADQPEGENNKSGFKENDESDQGSDAEILSNKKNNSKNISKKRKSERNIKKDDSDLTESELKDDDSDTDVSKETPKKNKGKSKKKKNEKRQSKKSVDEEEYEVESIVNSKKIKGKLHYLIRWKGYSADSDTWEPFDTLSCPDIINKYNEGKENSEDASPKRGKKRKASKKESKSPAKKSKTKWDSENADENAEYEVERILEVHHKKSGEREFLIHWKGWSSKFDSWEPEMNLNCSELIKKFMDKVSSARSTEGRSLRVAPESTSRFTLQDPSSGRRLSKRQGQRQRVRYDNAE